MSPIRPSPSSRRTPPGPGRRTAPLLAVLAAPALLAAAACGGGDAEAAPRLASTPDSGLVAPPAPVTRKILETEKGEATFYADLLDRKRTASGELLDQHAMVAAHKRYPFGTVLRVTAPETGKSVQVRVIDRGPYAHGKRYPAILDLSRAAARRLGILEMGRALVVVDVLEWGRGLPGTPG